MHYFLGGWQAKANMNVVENVAGVERAIIGNVLNVIRIVGTGLALIMLAWMSLSYFATDGKSMPGAVERKADIKGKQLWKFTVGVALFIGASNILYFMTDFIADVFDAVFH